MPKPVPIAQDVRDIAKALIEAGHGRNEIARHLGISTGAVSKIARDNYLVFIKAWATASAVQCRRIDLAVWRADQEGQLLNELSDALDGNRQRHARKIEKRLADLHRFHQPFSP